MATKRRPPGLEIMEAMRKLEFVQDFCRNALERNRAALMKLSEGEGTLENVFPAEQIERIDKLHRIAMTGSNSNRSLDHGEMVITLFALSIMACARFGEIVALYTYSKRGPVVEMLRRKRGPTGKVTRAPLKSISDDEIRVAFIQGSLAGMGYPQFMRDLVRGLLGAVAESVRPNGKKRNGRNAAMNALLEDFCFPAIESDTLNTYWKEARRRSKSMPIAEPRDQAASLACGRVTG